MTGLAWLLKNDPKGYTEKQPREEPVNPRKFIEYVGGVGVRKEFGVHRQYVEQTLSE
jgi:hypothetical protein